MAKNTRAPATTNGTRGRKGMTAEEKAAKAAEREAFKGMSPEEKDKVRAANFVRLGEPRINAAVSVIRRLGNLAGSNYRSTPEQIAFIKRSLTDAVADTLEKFERVEKPERPKLVMPT